MAIADMPVLRQKSETSGSSVECDDSGPSDEPILIRGPTFGKILRQGRRCSIVSSGAGEIRTGRSASLQWQIERPIATRSRTSWRGELFETRGDTACFVGPTNSNLCHMATPIRNALELEGATMPCPPMFCRILLRNHSEYAMRQQPAAHGGNIVAPCPGNHVTLPWSTPASCRRLPNRDRAQAQCGVRRLRCLACTQFHSQGQATTVSNQMQLGRKSAAAAPVDLIGRLAKLGHPLMFSSVR